MPRIPPRPPAGRERDFGLAFSQCLRSRCGFFSLGDVCFLVGIFNFDARLSCREFRNSWEKAMQTLILPELEVRGLGGRLGAHGWVSWERPGHLGRASSLAQGLWGRWRNPRHRCGPPATLPSCCPRALRPGGRAGRLRNYCESGRCRWLSVRYF